MFEEVVVDSTCLIGLERIRRLDILTRTFQKVAIPRAVAIEWGVDKVHTIAVHEVENAPLVSALSLQVDRGEVR